MAGGRDGGGGGTREGKNKTEREKGEGPGQKGVGRASGSLLVWPFLVVPNKGPKLLVFAMSAGIGGDWLGPQWLKSCPVAILSDLWNLLIRNKTRLATWSQRLLPAGTFLVL